MQNNDRYTVHRPLFSIFKMSKTTQNTGRSQNKGQYNVLICIVINYNLKYLIKYKDIITMEINTVHWPLFLRSTIILRCFGHFETGK